MSYLSAAHSDRQTARKLFPQNTRPDRQKVTRRSKRRLLTALAAALLSAAVFIPAGCLAQDTAGGGKEQTTSAPGWTPLKGKAKGGSKEKWEVAQKTFVDLMDSGQFELAAEEAMRGIKAARKAKNPGKTATFYSHLAASYNAQKRREAAREAWKQAIDILKTEPKPDVEHIAMIEGNIGNSYRESAQPEKALTYLVEATSKMSGKEASYGVLTHNLGMVYAALKKNSEAERTFRKSIEINSEMPNITIESMFSLSLLYAREERATDVLALLDKAIPLSEKTYGSDDPRTKKFIELRNGAEAAAIMKSPWKQYVEQAKAATDAMNYPQAIAYFENALKVAEKISPNSQSTGISYWGLGKAYMLNRQYSEAEEALSKALSTLTKYYGETSKDIDRLRESLAVARSNKLMSETLSKSKEAMSNLLLPPASGLSAPQVSVGSTTGFVGQLEWDKHMKAGATALQQRKLAEAEKAFSAALAIAEKATPPRPELAVSFNNLAQVYQQQNKLAKAESYYKRSLSLLESLVGTSHRVYGTNLNNLGLVYLQQGKFAESEKTMKRALSIQETSLGANSPELTPVLTNYAVVLGRMGRTAEANKLLARAKSLQPKSKTKN